MGFVNKVMLMGNLTRDPQPRQLPSGTNICEFGLATNRVFKTPAGEERQETVFVDCTCFGRTGEVIAEFCRKGRPIFIEGRLHFETWEDGSGNRRSKLTVIVENFQFVGGREAESSAGAQRNLYGAPEKPPVENQPAAKPQRAAAAKPAPAPVKGLKAKGAHTRRHESAVAVAVTQPSAAEAEDNQDVDLPF
jgi:single-strand DNA-binding protein